MSEAAFWANVKPVLHGLDPVRVETSDKDGIPDVNVTCGWIELKVTDWPARPETPVNFVHYTTQQRAWHRRRCRYGNCWLLVRIGTDVLLFWGEDAARVCGTANAAELSRAALRHWKRGSAWKKELKSALLEDRSHRGWGLFDDR